MKYAIHTTLAACTSVLLLIAQPVFAHDPAQHAKEAAAATAKPNCAAIKDMDMSKMNMNDPVMQAMHAKCATAQTSTTTSQPATTMMQHDNMPDMDHSKMDHSKMSMSQPTMDHSKMSMPQPTNAKPATLATPATPAPAATHDHGGH